MTKLKHSLVTIGGAVAVSFVFIQPITELYVKVFGRGSTGSVFDVRLQSTASLDALLYAFPFFLTLIEFFFKKPIIQRRPYLYVIGFFVLFGLLDPIFLLSIIAVLLIGAAPGSLYHWIKGRKQGG